MWEATVNGMLGGIGILLVLWACNWAVCALERNMRRAKGVTGYEIHESFQEKQAKRLRQARREGMR